METFKAAEYQHIIDLLCEGYAKAIGAEKMEKYRKQTTAFFKGNPETYPRVPCLPLHIQEVTGIDCKGSTFYQKYKAAQDGQEVKINEDLYQAFCQYLGLSDVRAVLGKKEHKAAANLPLNPLSGYYAVYNLWLEKNIIHLSFVEISEKGELLFYSKYKQYNGTAQVLAEGKQMLWTYHLTDTQRPEENHFQAFLTKEYRHPKTYLKGVYSGFNSEGNIRGGRSFCVKVAQLPTSDSPHTFEIGSPDFQVLQASEKELLPFLTGKAKDGYIDNFHCLSPEYSEDCFYAACYLAIRNSPPNLIINKLKEAFRVSFYVQPLLVKQECAEGGALYAYRDMVIALYGEAF